MRKGSLFCATVTLITICFFIVSCGPNNRAEKTLKLEKNGNVVLLKGQMLKIELQANPTTGYVWEVEQDKDGKWIEQIGPPEYIPYKRSDGRIGSGGTCAYRFKALKKGQTTLILNYKRPWQKGIMPAKKYELKVRIQ